MHLNDAFRSSLQSILNHKLRSFLTLLGIIIGVLAVVTMFSSVYSLKALIRKNMEGMGWNNSIIVTASGMSYDSRDQKKVVYKRTPENVKQLDYSDFDAIRTQLSYKYLYGMNEFQFPYRSGIKDIQVTLKGTNTAFFINKTYNLKSGRYFSYLDEIRGLPVIILGYYFAQEQFGKTDPVGKMINIGDSRYRIIGVLAKDKLNVGGGMNFNSWERKNDLKAVFIPLKYSTTYLSSRQLIQYIYVQAHGDEDYPQLKTRVRQLLLARHSMYPNFAFQDIGSMLMQINQEIDSAMKKWNVTLLVIASISLIVGGIGLFSTLLISIQEKMLEIGVRKSIGATESDIFFYFIFEAITLAVLGALVGIFLASLALLGMQTAFKIPMPMPVQGMVVGLFFSVLIGFLSGLYPALKASDIDPIKAIYYLD